VTPLVADCVLANLPVIVGVGQLTDRGDDLAAKREPLTLIADAASLAVRDARAPAVAERIDSVRVVNTLSGAAYDDPAGMLAARLGLGDGERLYTAIGGNGPQWLVNRTADDLAAGRIRAALIAGGEALYTLRLASKRGVMLPWTQGRGRAATIGDVRQGSHPDEWNYGLQMPTQIYPLFEVALRAHEGRPPAAHAAHLARLSASLAAVAATHPQAWFRDGKSAAEIGTPTASNRMVTYPYPKFMTSILDVDQAAAVIMTTVGEARRLGIPDAQLVHVHGAGEATDIWHVKDRVDYHSSPGMREAFRQALAQAAVTPSAVSLLDLYSCFPAAVRVAARVLDVPTDGTRPLTVTGGLPYFGGAGNNYALHAIVTMVDGLRSTPDALGLVSALGWYLTKHAVGVYGVRPPERPWARVASAQSTIDALPRPTFAPTADGAGRVETYSVVYDRDGVASQGVVVVRCDDGTRTLALIDDHGVLEAFEREEMVGAHGSLGTRSDGRNAFRPAGS
jgi:acetyl-CoA C-acetyltransferase